LEVIFGNKSGICARKGNYFLSKNYFLNYFLLKISYFGYILIFKSDICSHF